MDKINAIVESESCSRYSQEPIEHAKIYTDTKSRLLLHYNDDRIYRENGGKLNDQSHVSSASPLKTLEHQLMKEDKSAVKYSKQTRYNQEFDIDRFRRGSSKEVNSLGRTVPRAEKKSTIHLRNSSNGASYQGVSEAKANIRTNEYGDQFAKNSTNNETASYKNVKRKLPIRSHSFTHHNNENQTDDSPSHQRQKSTAAVKVQKELLRTRHNNELLNQLNGEQWSPPIDESIPTNEIQNESKLCTLNHERSNFNVDLQSMKRCLQNSSSAIKKFGLLQSLVLRLSNQEPVERFATIQAIVDSDLFGIKSENGNGTILEDILWPVNITTPHPLQTSAAKLLNALVSHEIGRGYFNGMSMVRLLTWSSREQIHDTMADNLIDAMKKLSLNKLQRHDMLKKGLLQWLIHRMETVEFSASMFHMECMTDLLRMLLNVENSTEFAFVNVPHLIIVLVRYLNVSNENVKVNIGHVLRTLFLNEAAVEIGNKINLHRIIRDHIATASNSKLRDDLQFIYEMFVKYRAHNSTEVEALHVSNSRFGSSEMPINCKRQNFNKDKDDPNEHLICETDLKRKSEYNNIDDRSGQKKNIQVPEKPSKSSPVDLKSCVMRMRGGEEFLETGVVRYSTAATTAAVDERNDRSDANMENCGAVILFSNLNSRLEQSSSLLCGGSQLATNKQNAIETLKMQSIEKNMAGDMDSVSKDLTTIITSTIQSPRVYDNGSPETLTDYSDLSSIAKDPVARNEILENDSFIDELCEKVFNKLRAKLAENFFCGTNCDTNSNTNCNNCCVDGPKV